MSFCGYCGHALPPQAGRVPDSDFPQSGTANSPLPGARPEDHLHGSLPQNNASTAAMPPAPPLTPPSAPGRIHPGQRRTRPPAKRIIAAVGILVVSILSILAVVQVAALLRRATTPMTLSGQPPFGAGATKQPTLATGAPGTISEVPLPSGTGGLDSITAGPDGNLWFTEAGNHIGRITPQGAISEFPISTTYTGPLALAAGPDGNLWFSEMGNQIGRITPQGVVTLMQLSFKGSGGGAIGQAGVAAGPDGNLWFTEGDQIVRLTPSGSATMFLLPSANTVLYLTQAIAAGPDGNLWFTVTELTNPQRFAIGRITPQGTVTLHPLPAGTTPQVIARGPNGNLWFTDNQGIGRITLQGVVTEFPLPNGGGAVDIAAGPDGNLWFTNYNGTIGRITPEGKITTFQVPNTDSNPSAITAGPDSNMWFTDTSRSGNAPMIGRVILGK